LKILNSEYHIILASKSPRRKELLASLGISFEAKEISVEENYPDSLNPIEIATYLSEKKSKAYGEVWNDKTIVITCDTIVVSGNNILGKPQNEGEGLLMLKELSGKTHRVITGVTFRNKSKHITFSETSSVLFEEHSNEVLMGYMKIYNPLDKAGGYGIQDCLDLDGSRLGPLNISLISGSYNNVMGLPLELVQNKLVSFINEIRATQ